MKSLKQSLPGIIVYGWVGLWIAYFMLDLFNYMFPIGPIGHPYLGLILLIAFKVGLIATIPAFVVLYRDIPNRIRFNPAWIIYTCAGAWGSYLLLLVLTPLFTSPAPWLDILVCTYSLAQVTTLPAAAVAILGMAKRSSCNISEKISLNGQTAKVVAGLTVLALSVSTFAAIRGIWLPITSKFIFTNLANGAGFTAAVLILLLNYLQQDIYWIARQRNAKLDERQVKERQQVFEMSYKIGAVLVLGAAYFLYAHKYDLPAIINNWTTFNVAPGDMFLPFFNVAMTLFALPLIIAAYRHRKHSALV